ncbi:hypothetical protein K505DRAFT_326641 [Melanomma pulvis-pyrius CBS 109.77]|uniref:Uncharacterized protein n=1 Tax=Melanomma pulvis-pyrius CBS 109.77 TaxID=1314802 RepID=A0A6A6X5X9_9PLEO|nr:hypothetical protein K505DRAFT_326641 [Melanomma pulvis-pyrius CBS 109.77]
MNASNTNTNTLRNQIWTAHQFVTPHTLALTRHYISKFEFALRKRCLTPERLSRLESEIHNGRVVKTISLQCIPWAYDQHFITNRPPEDFPWYGEGERVWMDGDLWYVTKEGEKRGRVWRRCGFFERRGQQQRDREEGGRKWAAKERDPLNQVPYLIYLGADAETV